ncbi:MAG TPA: tetratricopeptide repeat protein, partial [Solirubrobacterales bacterium]
ERAIEADPGLVANISNYALFLDEVRNDPARAEEMYERALAVDPVDANTLGNFARLALARKKEARAEELIDRALDVANEDALLVELWTYRFAMNSDGGAAKRQLSELVEKGARSPDWNFDGIVDFARSRRHPELDWLQRLVEVVSAGADAETLG